MGLYSLLARVPAVAIGSTRHLLIRHKHLFYAKGTPQNLHRVPVAAYHSNQNLVTKPSARKIERALDHNDVYEHATFKQFKIQTTPCFDESMQRTNPGELCLYFPDSMNYEVLEEPFLTTKDFYAWAKKDNRFSDHNIEVGTRYEGHRIFHGLEYSQKLFAHKNFVTAFSLDSIMDEISQIVESNPGIIERKFLRDISRGLANEVLAEHAQTIASPLQGPYPRIFERIEKFVSCYNDLTAEGEILFGSRFVDRVKELWARFIIGTADEVIHKVDQTAKGSSIHPWFWGLIRPYSGGLFLTGCLMYAKEAHIPPLDDPLEHDIHMIDVYDNEILSFHKEQSQTHFNMINGLVTQGLSQDMAFMSWVRMRNQKCRDVEILIEACRGNPLEECYRSIFRYQVDLFNYHIWSYHRYGWSRIV